MGNQILLKNGNYEIQIKIHRENITTRKGFDYFRIGIIKVHVDVMNLIIKQLPEKNIHFKGVFNNRLGSSFELILLGECENKKLVASFLKENGRTHLLGSITGKNKRNELEVDFIIASIFSCSNIQYKENKL